MTPLIDKDIKLIVIDLFCGAGGTTSGFEEVEDAEVIACVNHDENAIMSHEANHPDAEHFLEDITEMYGMVRNGILFKSPQLMRMIRLVDLYRAFYPGVKLIVWASLECTNFSKAKGGGSRDADSRTLAHHMDRYYVPLDADYLMFENVVEFMSWGPLMGRVVTTEQGYKCCELEFTEVDRPVIGADGCYVMESVNGDAENVRIRMKKEIQVQYDAVPNTAKNGADFMRWCAHILSFGYHDNNGQGWKEINSADFGAYTSRNRLFGIYAKQGLPIVWPEATHEKVKVIKPRKGAKKKKGDDGLRDDAIYSTPGGPMLGKTVRRMPELFESHIHRSPWKPVKDVLDFTDEGKSIFDRKKSLSDKTLERIYAGLIKFVAGGKENFLAKTYAVASNSDGVYSTDTTAHTITTRDSHSIVKPIFISKYYSGKPDGKNITLEGPAGTITTIDGQALVQAAFLSTYNGDNPDHRNRSLDTPAGTLTTTNTHAFIQAFMVQRNGGSPEGRVVDINGPARTITSTAGNQDVVSASFIHAYYGNGDNNHGMDVPAPTLRTKDGAALVHPVFIMRDFTGGGQLSSVDQPAGTVMPSPKMNLVTPQYHFIVNPSHGGNCTGTDVPCAVIVARQDKAPLSLTIVDEISGEPLGIAIRIDENDSDIMVKIKIFMVLYDIVDIKMRMLMIKELLKIQGFKENYVLIGTQADKKKFIGNAVHPLVPEHMAKALLRKLDEYFPALKAA